MGNIQTASNWTDLEIMQLWLPLLVDLFSYDDHGNIISLHQNPTLLNDSDLISQQLDKIPSLLKGKIGVKRNFTSRIKSLIKSPSLSNNETNMRTVTPHDIFRPSAPKFDNGGL